jgi:hypothetical protein
MAKKVSDVVMGMLSDAGSATRVTIDVAAPPADPPAAPPAADVSAPAPIHRGTVAAPQVKPVESPEQPSAQEPGAPRTLRLRPEAATRLRAAWLEAKRDDVLLTAQDYASDLVMEALVSRRRRRSTPA